MAKSKKKLQVKRANMQSDFDASMTMTSEGLMMSGPVMSTTTSADFTVDTLDAGFTYNYDDIGQLDMFDEMDMRDKYPALKQAHEHYISVLEVCKTKEKEENEN